MPAVVFAQDSLDAETRGQTTYGSIGPDLIIGEIYSLASYGSEGGIAAFSVGMKSCNAGDEPAKWFAGTNEHPIFTYNMYRLKENRFEQLGQSWLVHGFFALQGNACQFGCQPSGTGTLLGVGCSEPSSAGINGLQPNLGPKSQVNAFTGLFQYPPWNPPYPPTIGRRLQVHTFDLDPRLNQGARYFAAARIVSADDAVSGNGENNASYREIAIYEGGGDATLPCASRDAGVFCAALVDGASTQRKQPAIRAWKDHDATVVETEVRVSNEGLFILAAKAIDLGNGNWEYEYALQNINSHRSCGWFSVPIPNRSLAGFFGFHDVDYHSGEPFDGTDWATFRFEANITWSTMPFVLDPQANAIRWGTLYNIRFRSDSPPGETVVTLGLFTPGDPASITVRTIGPIVADCDWDGVGDLADLCSCSSEIKGCTFPPPGLCCWGSSPCQTDYPPELCEAQGGTTEIGDPPCASGCTPEEINGDFDRDGDRDLRDISMFLSCFSGREGPMDWTESFEECRARFDFDISGAIDLSDFQTFQPRLTGP